MSISLDDYNQRFRSWEPLKIILCLQLHNLVSFCHGAFLLILLVVCIKTFIQLKRSVSQYEQKKELATEKCRLNSDTADV